MEAYTLDRNFIRQSVVDVFDSFIWTERYYGNSDMRLVVAASKEAIDLLAPGTFVELDGSKEIMIIEEQHVKDGLVTVTGISLLLWLNNRFIRASVAHEDRYWNIADMKPGQIMWKIIDEMVVNPGPIGVATPEIYLIPDIGLSSQDESGDNVSVAVPYGPVYDALFELSTTYNIGMTLELERNLSTSQKSVFAQSSKRLKFRSYCGQDRTSMQSVNPVIRFSPEMGTLSDVEELTSLAAYKTHTVTFAPSNPDGLATTPGYASVGGSPSGFDLRARMVLVEDITTDQVGGDAQAMTDILNQRAEKSLRDNSFIAIVDGEIVPYGQIKYGRDYTLGDIVELAGHSGVVQNARVTEYIRSHDGSGETAYPTVSIVS